MSRLTQLTIPCAVQGIEEKRPFHVYVREPNFEMHPLKFQSFWLKQVRAATIPTEVMDSLERLASIAQESKVNYRELVDFAFKTTKEPPAPKGKGKQAAPAPVEEDDEDHIVADADDSEKRVEIESLKKLNNRIDENVICLISAREEKKEKTEKQAKKSLFGKDAKETFALHSSLTSLILTEKTFWHNEITELLLPALMAYLQYDEGRKKSLIEIYQLASSRELSFQCSVILDCFGGNLPRYVYSQMAFCLSDLKLIDNFVSQDIINSLTHFSTSAIPPTYPKNFTLLQEELADYLMSPPSQ